MRGEVCPEHRLPVPLIKMLIRVTRQNRSDALRFIVASLSLRFLSTRKFIYSVSYQQLLHKIKI